MIGIMIINFLLTGYIIENKLIYNKNIERGSYFGCV